MKVQAKIFAFVVLLLAAMIATPGDRWSALVRRLLTQSDFAARIETPGGQIAKANTPEEFASFVERDIGRWARIIKAANIRIE